MTKEITMYHPLTIEIVAGALALGGALLWFVGMLLLVRYAGKGTFS